MTLGLAFWILMLIWLVFGLWTDWPNVNAWAQRNLFLFVLFLLLGWHSFGAPIHG